MPISTQSKLQQNAKAWSPDHPAFARARKARDARFDGLFFTAVKTTGIYCRPICPAPAALEKNVEYYPNAFGAAQAGYRPCIRCRPDSSPGSNAWQGSETTVRRAIELIERGELQDSSLHELAERLGVTDRYLRKLFASHIGVGPKQFALYQQCLFAKKLLQETRLPIGDVAYAAGFNSVRRFNSAIKDQLRITPTDLRKRNDSEGDDIVLRLHYRPPFDVNAMFKFLHARCIEGLETSIEGRGVYARTFVFERGGKTSKGYFSIKARMDEPVFDVAIKVEHIEHLYAIVQRVRVLFDVDAPIADIAAHLESMLAGVIDFNPGLRVPGIWNLFETGVRAILGQQVTVTAAKNLVTQAVQQLGEATHGFPSGLDYYFPTPEAFLKSDLSFFAMPASRKDTLHRLARYLLESDAPEDVDRWLDIKGIGPWTVNYVKLRALKEPDVWLAGDAGIKNALKQRARHPNAETADQTLATSISPNDLRPWRSYATLQLWNQL